MKTIQVDYATPTFKDMVIDAKFIEFKKLVEPGCIDIVLLKRFFEGFVVDRAFTYYKMHVQQNTYSTEDIKKLRKVVSHYAYVNDATVSRVFKPRSSKNDKELAYRAFINTRNMWLLLTNAIDEPIKLELRGSL